VKPRVEEREDKPKEEVMHLKKRGPSPSEKVLQGDPDRQEPSPSECYSEYESVLPRRVLPRWGADALMTFFRGEWKEKRHLSHVPSEEKPIKK
jgi:hypothetical protein